MPTILRPLEGHLWATLSKDGFREVGYEGIDAHSPRGAVKNMDR